MQFFNVGVLELLFILVLAFVVLGPGRSVKMARNIGVWIRKFVKSPFWRELISTSNEIRDLPNRIMDDAELQQMISELDLSSQDIKDIIGQAQSETRTGLQEVENQINQDLQLNPSPTEKPRNET